MAMEARRGCGYRKIGGLYLMGPKFFFTCDRGAIPLHVCPVCRAGVKPSRAWTWIQPLPLFGAHKICKEKGRSCPLCYPNEEDAGLLWTGEKFYTPESFMKESHLMGISRRIPQIPKGLKVGKTVVYMAHRKAIVERVPTTARTKPLVNGEVNGLFKTKFTAGIFMAFVPQRVEMLVSEHTSTNDLEMAKLKKRGITPVVVPDEHLSDHS